MQELKLILKISRPHFWLYLGGTYLIGSVLGIHTQSQILTPQFFLYLFYFLLPANIFLYGINDYYDEDTDKFNPRKKEKEHRLVNTERSKLRSILILCILFSVFLLFLQKDFWLQIVLDIFILLSYFYSAPPLRFKSKIFLDSLSNILYILPGIFGYVAMTHAMPTHPVVMACFCWAIAMHLFSAIPDIAADSKAGILTTAIYLGKKGALSVCSALWFFFALMLIPNLLPFSLILLIYPILPLIVILNKTISIEKVYSWYPYINGLLGFLFFCLLFFTKPYA